MRAHAGHVWFMWFVHVGHVWFVPFCCPGISGILDGRLGGFADASFCICARESVVNVQRREVSQRRPRRITCVGVSGE